MAEAVTITLVLLAHCANEIARGSELAVRSLRSAARALVRSLHAVGQSEG